MDPRKFVMFFWISKHQSSSVRNLRLRAINYFQWGSCLFMLYVSALSNSLCDFLAGLAGDLVCNPSRVSFSFRSCLALATGRPHSTTLNAEPFYISKVSGGKSSTKKAIRGCKHLRHNHRNRYLHSLTYVRNAFDPIHSTIKFRLLSQVWYLPFKGFLPNNQFNDS